MVDAGAAAVEVLAQAGVRRFYTVPGESFLEVLDAVEQRPDVQLVSTRHESGASFMAEADAKLTGVPAVAMATRGVGATNLSIGVHTALQDSTPMVVLLGQAESTILGREAFQEVDLTAFYAPITKWSITATRSERIPELVARGLRIATSGRPGPVMIALPADLLGEELDEGVRTPPFLGRPLEPAPSASQRDELVHMLAAAKRPVVIAGGGARGSQQELIAFVEKFGLGLYAAFRRQDVLPNSHPNYLGHLGLGTDEESVRALDQADLVLVLGCRLSEITTQTYAYPRPGCPVVQVDVDPAAIAAVVPVELGIVSTVRALLDAMLEVPTGGPARNWTAQHQIYLDASTPPAMRPGDGIHPAQVYAALKDLLPEDGIIANDAGNFSGFLHRYWRYEQPRTQLAPTNGAMGYGVPAAVAAKLAQPRRSVVAIAGDGGFLMTGQEIETAVRYQAPILVVVLNNAIYGTIAMHQAQAYGRTAGIDISPVDLAGYARGLGAVGFTVNSADEIHETVRQALNCGAPALVDIRTDPDIISPTARMSTLLATHSEGPSGN
jgi:acetolactate synthase-1/2/3 large subunit